MTNKEAIETLKSNYPSSRYSMLREAVDAAISALIEQDTRRYGIHTIVKSLEPVKKEAERMITREELFKAVRTIHEFCMSRKRCVQDSGTDWCPIFDCCDRLPKEWKDPEGGDEDG